MAKHGYWLIKTEPSDYSYAALCKDRRTLWAGIRNAEARNHLRAMKKGDLALFYHTGDEKRVVGVARVCSAPRPDPTALGFDWTAVEVEPYALLERPVTLAQMKADPVLKDLLIVRRGRLSVTPVDPSHFDRVLALGRG